MSAFQVNAPGYTLRRLSPGTWEVTAPSGAVYVVDPEAGSCTCPDAQARGHRRACKHLRGLWALLKLVPALEEGALDHREDVLQDVSCIFRSCHGRHHRPGPGQPQKV